MPWKAPHWRLTILMSAAIGYAQNFATYALRHIEFVEIGDKSGGDTGLPLKALNCVFQDAEQAL